MKSWCHGQIDIRPRPNSHQRRFYFLIISSLCLGLCLADYIEELGAPCDEYKEPCIYSLKCINSRCLCNNLLTKLEYTLSGVPVCSYHFSGTGTKHLADLHIASLFGNNTCNPECTIKQECRGGRCQCVEGYVESQVVPSCREVVYVKPMQTCGVSRKASLCDPNLFSTCKSSICICFKNYYYNITSKECLPKPSGYKALHNEYCRENSDCIEGLSCSDSLSQSKYRCKCPSSCSYKDEFGACDCGEVYMESPLLVIVVGCMIGIGSVIFWIFCINRTWKRAGGKRDSNDIGEDNPLDDIPPGNTYPVDQPITLNAQPNSFADEPPTYKEALIGPSAAQIGFNINNTSVMDEARTTNNGAPHYVPYFPPLQNNYQYLQNIPPPSTGNLPYPNSAGNSTDPTLITDHPTNLSPLPYPVSPQMQTNLIAASSATAPYPPPFHGTSDKSQGP